MPKIAHIITGLTGGGAERMVAKLVRAMDARQFQNLVVSLSDKNVVGRDLAASGFPVFALNMRRPWVMPRPLLSLGRLLRVEKVHVVQTWLYHADLLGGLVAKCNTRVPIAWNVRNSSLDPLQTKRTTRLAIRAGAFLSHFVPTRIVFCSEKSRQLHIANGYCAQKTLVIPNGLDLSVWKPDAQARVRLRLALGIPDDAIVIGHAARYHPQKDHAGFVRAAMIAQELEPCLRFILCGNGIDWNNDRFAQLFRSSRGVESFRLLGPREDIQELMNAFDVVCCSSAFGEAFPNVLIEAMACRVPCVTTDVGDAPYIVGDTGLVVPPNDPPALGKALVQMVRLGQEGRVRLGHRASARVAALFDISSVARAYESFYLGLLRAPGLT